MSSQSVLNRVATRLSQDPQGDRGWFIITRVHVDVHWLKDIADYIFQKCGNSTCRLNAHDYSRLAQLTGTGVGNTNPGMQLRRHHLLVMYKPLQLIERIQSRSWAEIRLTPDGLALAQTRFPSSILESVLNKIVFAQAPAIPNDRIQAYSQFNVQAYQATHAIMRACNGYIDRDEFDYFVSRVRNSGEISWAIDGIIDYRKTIASLSNAQTIQLKDNLSSAVKNNLTDKQYQNWRDIGLHTFSLFGTGTSMVRRGVELWLTSTQVSTNTSPTAQGGAGGGGGPGAAGPRKKASQQKVLKVPVPPANPNLLEPPAPRVLNGGTEAENLVAKLLQADGWKIAFYSDKRGYGFDIWAIKNDRAMLIEVKSSLRLVQEITLTDTEYAAATQYRDNYVVAVVENAHDENPTVSFIVDPAHRLKSIKSDTTYHRFAHSAWRPIAITNFS